MEQHQFDSFTVTLAQPESRRRAVRLLGAAAFGALSLAALAPAGSDARKRKKHKKHKKGKGNQRCLKSGELCNSDKQCCGGNLVCDVPFNASNSDHACCGAQGAVCGGVDENGDAQPPFCCIGEAGARFFVCSENDQNNPNVRGTCLPPVM